jgi:ribose 5-phosphate isomerase B
MRIHLAADYLGYELARQLEAWLRANHEVIWHAGDELDEGDDYPLFAVRVGQSVIADEDKGLDTFGVLVGGTGNGEIIALNKVKGVRAALAVSADLVAAARQEQNANALVIGANHTGLDQAKQLIQTALDNEYVGAIDSSRRIINVGEYENLGTIEGWLVEG